MQQTFFVSILLRSPTYRLSTMTLYLCRSDASITDTLTSCTNVSSWKVFFILWWNHCFNAYYRGVRLSNFASFHKLPQNYVVVQRAELWFSLMNLSHQIDHPLEHVPTQIQISHSRSLEICAISSLMTRIQIEGRNNLHQWLPSSSKKNAANIHLRQAVAKCGLRNLNLYFAIVGWIYAISYRLSWKCDASHPGRGHFLHLSHGWPSLTHPLLLQ